MILYYAIGGGLGHLTRGRRVLELLGLSEQAVVVTASRYVDDARVLGSLPFIRLPLHVEHDPKAHRAWMRMVTARLGVTRLIADTFPGGIHGELCGLDLRIDHVARLLRWDAYRSAVPEDLPRLGTTWIVEALAPEQHAYVRAMSDRVVELDLTSAVPTKTAAIPGSYWVVVHSGPEEEVRELVAYATELRELTEDRPARVLVASPCEVEMPDGFQRTNAVPATPLFAGAARIISAAGFNVMLETEPWSAKHDVVPFSRVFDDQYARAARRRGKTIPR